MTLNLNLTRNPNVQRSIKNKDVVIANNTFVSTRAALDGVIIIQ